MKKSVLLLAATALAWSTSFAQLTTRENCPSVVCLDARPQGGDMALTFALNLTSGDVANLDIRNSLGSGDVLTFKKYKSSDVAYRIGIRLYRESAKYTGSSDSATQASTGGPSSGPFVTEREYKDSYRHYILAPGIEKHFAQNNFFDAYMGGDLYLGLGRDVNINNTDWSDGAYSRTKTITPEMVFGLGGVVGFNVFMAHLPVSIGLEYGWNLKMMMGGRSKVELESKASSSATAISETYYTTTIPTIDTDGDGIPDDAESTHFSDLKQSRFGMDTNQNVRVCLNVYFGTGSK